MKRKSRVWKLGIALGLLTLAWLRSSQAQQNPAPSIVFAGGEEASVQSGLTSEMAWDLRVEVAADASEAKWSSRATLGEQMLSLSTGSVRLAED